MKKSSRDHRKAMRALNRGFKEVRECMDAKKDGITLHEFFEQLKTPRHLRKRTKEEQQVLKNTRSKYLVPYL